MKTDVTRKMEEKGIKDWGPVILALCGALFFFMDPRIPLNVFFADMSRLHNIKVDLLPDFIGWMILLGGFRRCSIKEVDKNTFQWLCGIAFCFSLGGFILEYVAQCYGSMSVSSYLYVFLHTFIWLTLWASELLVVWNVFTVIGNAANLSGHKRTVVVTWCLKIGYALMPFVVLMFFVMGHLFQTGVINEQTPMPITLLVVGLPALLGFVWGYLLRIVGMVVTFRAWRTVQSKCS